MVNGYVKDWRTSFRVGLIEGPEGGRANRPETREISVTGVGVDASNSTVREAVFVECDIPGHGLRACFSGSGQGPVSLPLYAYK